jgi:hypothetical protein
VEAGIPPSCRERQIEAGSVVRVASAAYTDISPFFPPPSILNSCRLGVLGLREAMGYAMICRRRRRGQGEAPAKIAHAQLRVERSTTAVREPSGGERQWRLGRADGKLVRKR